MRFNSSTAHSVLLETGERMIKIIPELKLHCISVNQSKLTTLPCFQSVLEAANLKLISDVKHSDIPASSSTNNKDLYGVALLKILWCHQRSLLHRRVPHHTTSTVR